MALRTPESYFFTNLVTAFEFFHPPPDAYDASNKPIHAMELGVLAIRDIVGYEFVYRSLDKT